MPRIETEFGAWYNFLHSAEDIPQASGFKKYEYKSLNSDFDVTLHIFANNECVVHDLFAQWSKMKPKTAYKITGVLDI